MNDGETEVSRWGYTWASDGAGVSDDDRIDFVYYKGLGVSVTNALIIGDANGNGQNGSDDVNIKAWWDNGSLNTVSDHRAVTVRFSITSVPEPSSVVVLGLVSLVGLVRRKRNINLPCGNFTKKRPIYTIRNRRLQAYYT